MLAGRPTLAAIAAVHGLDYYGLEKIANPDGAITSEIEADNAIRTLQAMRRHLINARGRININGDIVAVALQRTPASAPERWQC